MNQTLIQVFYEIAISIGGSPHTERGPGDRSHIGTPGARRIWARSYH